MQQILLQHWIPSCILEENGLPMVSLKSSKRVFNDLVKFISPESLTVTVTCARRWFERRKFTILSPVC
jgi:hypothetical protein